MVMTSGVLDGFSRARNVIGGRGSAANESPAAKRFHSFRLARISHNEITNLRMDNNTNGIV